MKLIAAPIAALVAGLLAFPVLFATGDADPARVHRRRARSTPSSPRSAPSSPAATTPPEPADRQRPAPTSSSTAPGPTTAATPTPGKHPQHVQDAKAVEHVAGHPRRPRRRRHRRPRRLVHRPPPRRGLRRVGHRARSRRRQPSHPTPVPARWLTEYEQQLAGVPHRRQPRRRAACPATPIAALADGYAYPGPPELFANAPVDSPHHDYPAWDWALPTGTPIYAVRGGRVTAVQYWPYNWWDHGCATNADRLLAPAGSASPSKTTPATAGPTATAAPSTSTSATPSPPAPRSSPPATPAAPAARTSTSRSAPPTARCAAPSHSCDRCATTPSASTPPACPRPAASTDHRAQHPWPTAGSSDPLRQCAEPLLYG